MIDQGYGRIVMTTSSGLFGLPENLSYATAKGGVIGLDPQPGHGWRRRTGSRSISSHPAPSPGWPAKPPRTDPTGPARHGCRRNSSHRWSPSSPMRTCPVSGEIYAAGFGRFARIFIASTEGYVHATPEPTIEDVARHWATINDETGYYVPADLMAWSAAFMAHLSPSGGDSVAS